MSTMKSVCVLLHTCLTRQNIWKNNELRFFTSLADAKTLLVPVRRVTIAGEQRLLLADYSHPGFALLNTKGDLQISDMGTLTHYFLAITDGAASFR